MSDFKGGLTPTPVDERDFQLGAITRLPDLSELPDEFIIKPLRIKNQGNTDFCSAYMTCAMSEAQEGITLEPSYSFAVSKEISGDKESWGQNLRDACKSHLKGALPEDQSPYSVKTKDDSFLRDINNWNVPESVVYPHRKKSYFKVTGPYDEFDNARASLFKFKSPIGTGVTWGWPVTQHILNTVKKGFGHAVTIIGFKDDMLILQNSYGTQAGDNGLFYVTRDVYNYYADRFGQYMFLDIDKGDAKYNIENGIKLEDNWLVGLIKVLLSWIRGFATH